MYFINHIIHRLFTQIHLNHIINPNNLIFTSQSTQIHSPKFIPKYKHNIRKTREDEKRTEHAHFACLLLHCVVSARLMR